MNCVCDYDPPSSYVPRMQTARKYHECSECKSLIQKGERYEYVFGVWDGRYAHFKTCPTCLALRDWVKAHVPCFCWSHGNMRSDAIETADWYAPQAPGLMFGTYRRVVAIKRRRLGQRPATSSAPAGAPA